MTGEPEAFEGFVHYEQDSTAPDATMKRPHEAETLAMSLLGAASEARAQELINNYRRERDTAFAAFTQALSERYDTVSVGVEERDDATESGREIRRLWVRTPRGNATLSVAPELVPTAAAVGVGPTETTDAATLMQAYLLTSIDGDADAEGEASDRATV